MIPFDTLRDAYAKADQGEMVVQAMNSRRDFVMLSTMRPGARTIGMFTDHPDTPAQVAHFRAESNATFAKLAWEWMPQLLDEIERLQKLVDADDVELATRAAGGSKKK